MKNNAFINFKKNDVISFLGIAPIIIIYGMLTRIYIDPKTSVDFIANTMSLAVIITLIYLYLALMDIAENLPSIVNFISNKTNKKPLTIKREAQITQVIKSKESQEELIKKEKLAVAFDYTTKEFAPYISSKDLDRLCSYLQLYYENKDLDKIQFIETNTLKTIDIYHFGWNIWNYFNVSNQDNLVVFLKKVFLKKLEQVKDDETIKKNLKNKELIGFIKITEDLKILNQETND